MDVWYQTVEPKVIKTFTSLLRTLPPNDPVLVLGILELASDSDKPDPAMLRDLFGFSTKNQFKLERPNEVCTLDQACVHTELTIRQKAREEFFEGLISYVRMRPTEFPDPDNRKKRKLPELEVAPALPAKEAPLSADQLKQQKKQDRLTLNMLKMQIQPIMEQLKKTYRKFFKPIIDESQILYLYDEQNPNFVGTDLPQEQHQEQGIYRPFELAKDRKGTPGLLHTESGNFYYNLDLTIIEKRLSNGYYKRARDFLTDIKTLAKDARILGDPDRTIKANEMLSNVEVDTAGIVNTNPALAAECEAVFLREQERAQKTLEKAQQSTATGEEVPVIKTNVPPQVSGTTTETSGPVMLGEQVPGPQTLPPVTPIRYPKKSLLSNGTSTGDGYGRQSNGSTIATRGDEDTHMTDSQDLGSGPREAHDFQLPSGHGTQRSQVSGRTFVAPNSHPGEYHNSASTTTSGQRSGSNRSSGPQNFNTQSTNGVSAQLPDFASMAPQSGGSQIPDTQGEFTDERPDIHKSLSNTPTENTYLSSQMSNSQPSQSSQLQFSMPAPPRQAAISSILNNEQPRFFMDNIQVKDLHQELVRRSSGLSVEQLEQVNSALMDTIWRNRGQWNRNSVIHNVTMAFNDIIKDIEYMQAMLPPSQPEEEELGAYPPSARRRDVLFRPDETQYPTVYQQGGGDNTQFS